MRRVDLKAPLWADMKVYSKVALTVDSRAVLLVLQMAVQTVVQMVVPKVVQWAPPMGNQTVLQRELQTAPQREHWKAHQTAVQMALRMGWMRAEPLDGHLVHQRGQAKEWSKVRQRADRTVHHSEHQMVETWAQRSADQMAQSLVAR